jgi:hypothetical protein
MKIHTIFSVLFFLLISACQRGGSAPAIPVTASTVPTPTVGATPTINIVTLVVPTRTLTVTQTEPEIRITLSPFPSPTTGHIGDRPLLIPRILQVDYGPQVTRLVIGFDIHPTYRGNPEIFGEIYDATLTDQTGREIAGNSMERSAPEKSILEFAPLPSDVTSLTLNAQLALRGVPAQAPLAIDVSSHPLDQAWSIQTQVHIGDLGVQLHTARLFREDIGASTEAKQQVSLELRGENADLNGAHLICLALSPLPPTNEGSMSCGQEPGGIDATVSLGPVVDRTASLPMPTGLVILQASADFLLPGFWETTWLVKP